MGNLSRLSLMVAALLILLCACGGASVAPSGLSYSTNPATYTRGVAITPNTPKLGAGDQNTFSVSPALPAGLTLDSASGVLSGTPIAVAPAASYQVTVKNSLGSTGCSLRITTVDAVPTGLTYALSPAVYFTGVAIAPNTPSSHSGVVSSYVISPALPAGLLIDSETGILSGTPTALAAAKDYTVTASNSAGATTASVNLTVASPTLTIGTQPASQTILLGQTARFSITASGQGPLTYAWSKNGVPIAGATASSCITPAAVVADNGALFTVVVSDTYGDSLTSSSATLTVSNVAPGMASATGTMTAGRAFHTATLLPNGKVLIAGGFSGIALASAELYDPAAYGFTAVGPMANARENHTATLLPNGKVLVCGGDSFNVAVASCEIFDPATGLFTPTAGLGTARTSHSATLLPGGKVLVAGGRNGSSFVATAELYDPAAGTFSGTGSLGQARSTHTATLLQDGTVLVAGGFKLANLASAEVYDPALGTFKPAGTLLSPRAYHTAHLLANGQVLMVGGTSSAAAELYNPISGAFAQAGNLVEPRSTWHTGTLLANGKVLVAGGVGVGTPAPLLGATELYDAALGASTASGNLLESRETHTATLLADGRVLLAGGVGGGGYLDSAELFQ